MTGPRSCSRRESAKAAPFGIPKVTEPRQAIDHLRARYGLSEYAWTHGTLAPAATRVKVAGRTAPTYTTPTLTGGVSVISAVHVMELRDAVRAVW